VERQEKLRVPLNNLGSIACFGRVSCSVPLMGACAERGIGLAFLTDYGRLVAVVNGFSPGNVLLRREQYRTSDDLTKAAAIARGFVVGKLANFRTVLRRAGRELSDQSASEAVGRAASRIDQTLRQLDRPIDLDSLRGIEGDSTAAYFSVFAHLITANRDAFRMDGRSRRPPLDPRSGPQPPGPPGERGVLVGLGAIERSRDRLEPRHEQIERALFVLDAIPARTARVARAAGL
ncbi:CRISPR-associated endonuclease Cas1, partial [candidate division KSB1 bacterium]|nr:CRISPR-associated endonuclease Cas1 [candidate division KSB1 bacterium]